MKNAGTKILARTTVLMMNYRNLIPSTRFPVCGGRGITIRDMKQPKAVKILYMGKPLREVYPHATRWQVIKYKTMKAVRWFAIRVTAIAAAMLVVGGSYALGQFDNHRTVFAENLFPGGESTESKIAQMKHDLVNDLAKRENQGGVPCYLDDNKAGTLPKKDKISCGPMAYKVSTVQRHAAECSGVKLSNEEAVSLALDEVRVKDLAECAIFEHGHLSEWSAATGDMFATVRVIKQLEK